MGSKIKLPKINKKNFPYKLVICYWEDIVSDASWIDIVDIKKAKTAICCSVGWLIKNDDKVTVVMADYSFEDNKEIKQGGSYTTIPTKNVLSIKKIKLQEKPVAKKKRKKRTIQDVIEDIRKLHEKEEDLLMELEDKADDLDNNEGEE